MEISAAPKNLATKTQRGSIEMHVKIVTFSAGGTAEADTNRSRSSGKNRLGRSRRCGRAGGRCGKLGIIFDNLCVHYRIFNLFSNNQSQTLLMVVSIEII
jgi:hypothetical protein